MFCTVKNTRHKSNAGKLCPPPNIGVVDAGSGGGGSCLPPTRTTPQTLMISLGSHLENFGKSNMCTSFVQISF